MLAHVFNTCKEFQAEITDGNFPPFCCLQFLTKLSPALSHTLSHSLTHTEVTEIVTYEKK